AKPSHWKRTGEIRKAKPGRAAPPSRGCSRSSVGFSAGPHRRSGADWRRPMSVRRRVFLLGTGACSAGLIPCAAALSAPVAVALVSDDTKSQDVAGLFEEAGLTCDAVGLADAGNADPARHALLWLTC